MEIRRVKQFQIIVDGCADCPFLCGIDTQTVRCFVDDDLRTLKYADCEEGSIGVGEEYPEECPLMIGSARIELVRKPSKKAR